MFLAAYEQADTWKSAINGQVTAYLLKPVTQAVLENVLHQINSQGPKGELYQHTRKQGVKNVLADWRAKQISKGRKRAAR